ncbi:MAG TPA: protein kinase [Geminicoccaceae bacterium]|nr:protein kinase [Geminicoccaceae bacterium]
MSEEATRIGAAGGGRGAGQLPAGAILAHTFEIVGFIRAGGMGEVYEARHLVDGSRLAVKFIRPDLVGDERIRAMFVREAGILRRIHNDAVVSYEGLLQDEQGRSFLAMSYVDGPSLAERAQTRPLGTDEAMRLLTRLARGLAAVHAEGTFHRDLSPDNILLPGGDLDRAVIIDFGIAKLGEPQAGTLVGGDIAGKASYMSPEQLGVIRHEVDARSDIYSLALTMAAAMRGRSLYAGGSWAEVVEARRHVPDLEGIGEPLRGLLAHMLQPDPADRPQSMTELLRAAQAPGKAEPGAPARERGGAAAPAQGRMPRGTARPALKPVPVALGAAALLLLAGLGYLFFGPREDIDLPPPVTEETAPDQEAPAPDLADLEARANQALAGIACSELSARVTDAGSAAVSGIVSQQGDLHQITGTLDGIGLAGVDTNAVVVDSRPVCSAASLVERATQAGALSVWTNRPDGVFRDGDYLVVHAAVPPGAPQHLYIAYVDPGGDVVHLRPSPTMPDSLVDGGSEVLLGSETPDAAGGARYYQLGAPYGRAVVVALASAAPLFTGPRAEVEPAATYLAALEQALTAQGGQVQGGWAYLDITAGD